MGFDRDGVWEVKLGSGVTWVMAWAENRDIFSLKILVKSKINIFLGSLGVSTLVGTSSSTLGLTRKPMTGIMKRATKKRN